MSKNNRSNDDKFEKGGYQPLNEGYTPREKRGYVPNDQGGNLPKAPVGGTGQTQPTTSNSSSDSQTKK